MTEQDVFEELKPLIAEVTGTPADRIAMDDVLVDDLGAESIDLLDLSFLIEERFGVTLEPNEFERQVRQRIPDDVYDVDGVLTDAAIDELRRAMPEIAPERFTRGLRKMQVPSLLTVAVFVHLIQRKVAAREATHA